MGEDRELVLINLYNFFPRHTGSGSRPHSELLACNVSSLTIETNSDTTTGYIGTQKMQDRRITDDV